ncbi:protein of unknown function [Bradyrhizobium lablabi]|uniref:eCIS core domain-containing protein n=1 Tax=Bradyrhizobium lablabi TaxID=722472 RepID=A0A1M6KAP2_9BRAD|nr:DUF4157 domain-containing protein [Bradyrhizobium lablabi]SHJ56020.1 protein of unknown function [Bradyrhizobium lablabi]
MSERALATARKQSTVLAAPGGAILLRKCACGNHTMAGATCEECKKTKTRFQPKLTIGASNGPLELEADRIADQVMAGMSPGPTGSVSAGIQRSAAYPNRDSDFAPPSVDSVLAGSGMALQPELREKMERRFAYDFSHVRVHTGPAAEQSAGEVRADAYTVGNNIVFGNGRFAPHSDAGRRLLAHELVHVVQQSSGDGLVAEKSDKSPNLPTTHAQVTNQVSETNETSTRGDVSRIPDLQLQRQASDDLDAGAPSSTEKQKKCIKDSGGCPGGDRSGIPTCDEILALNQQCRRDTGYEGPDVTADCPSGFVPDCNKSPDGKLAPKQPESSPKNQEATPCSAPFTPATTFQQLIDLVRAAEVRLSKAGISSAKDQIHALRGIYYGTTWSLDYAGTPTGKGEQSVTRNEGFQRFTRPSLKPEDSIPRDVRPLLDCGLSDALKMSQDVIEPTRHVDFGHLLIALDARYDPQLASRISYPYVVTDVDMGGTGTELVTWLGDLGGGAAKVAILRASAPSTNIKEAFAAPSDYGGTVNLEGDVAGFVVATSSKDSVTAPAIPSDKGLSDALQEYLSPAAPGSAWKGRAATFLSMYGGKLDPGSSTLTNRDELVSNLAPKIQVFACNYLASRVKDKHVTFSVAKSAADHVIPTSLEIAGTFLDALTDAAKSGGNIEAKRFPAPQSKASGACRLQIAAGGLLGGIGL